MEEQRFKAMIVWLIANGKPEEALGRLAEHYSVEAPKLKVGLPKGRKVRSLGCYNARSKTISVLNSDSLKNPFIVIHEFYHHLRTGFDMEHRGTERHADGFAREFIQAHKTILSQSLGNN